MSNHPFRRAVEAGNHEGAFSLVADNVRCFSPVTFTPIDGAEQVRSLLRIVASSFEDFRYVDEAVDGETAALVFKARINGKEIHGVDLLHTRSDNKIDSFTVMLRPLSAVHALATAISPQVVAAGIGVKPASPAP